MQVFQLCACLAKTKFEINDNVHKLVEIVCKRDYALTWQKMTQTVREYISMAYSWYRVLPATLIFESTNPRTALLRKAEELCHCQGEPSEALTNADHIIVGRLALRLSSQEMKLRQIARSPVA